MTDYFFDDFDECEPASGSRGDGPCMAEIMTKTPQRVAIIGQGYVGLPVAIRAVEAGFDVVGAELDQNKVDGLAAGVSHIDDITDAQISEALGLGRYTPTSNMADLANFDFAVITVPTPLRDGAPDMSYIESASRTVAAHIRPGSTVILESTTYPGTTEEFVAPILEEVSGLRAGRDFHLGFSPERIDPGNETWDFRRTPKIVSGMDDASLAIIQDFYNQLVDQTVATSGTREAELAKLLENTFRHVNIALVNELAVNSRALGIDFWNVVEAASTKPFGFMPFYPGRASAATACQSTLPTCPGSSNVSLEPSVDLSRLLMTSTTACQLRLCGEYSLV